MYHEKAHVAMEDYKLSSMEDYKLSSTEPTRVPLETVYRFILQHWMVSLSILSCTCLLITPFPIGFVIDVI